MDQISLIKINPEITTSVQSTSIAPPTSISIITSDLTSDLPITSTFSFYTTSITTSIDSSTVISSAIVTTRNSLKTSIPIMTSYITSSSSTSTDISTTSIKSTIPTSFTINNSQVDPCEIFPNHQVLCGDCFHGECIMWKKRINKTSNIDKSRYLMN